MNQFFMTALLVGVACGRIRVLQVSSWNAGYRNSFQQPPAQPNQPQGFLNPYPQQPTAPQDLSAQQQVAAEPASDTKPGT